MVHSRYGRSGQLTWVRETYAKSRRMDGRGGEGGGDEMQEQAGDTTDEGNENAIHAFLQTSKEGDECIILDMSHINN